MPSKNGKALGSRQLTDAEKKRHHIESEHRRREQIRATFDRLVDIVPDLEPKEKRSELVVINKTSEYIKKLRAENAQMMEEADKLGITVPEELTR